MEKRRMVPDFLLEQLLAGELSPGQEKEILRELDVEPGGRERLARLRASSHEILLRYPPEAVVPEIKSRLASAARLRPVRPHSWVTVSTLALAAAIVLFVLLPIMRKGPPENIPTVSPPGGETYPTRIKGEPRLIINRRTPGGEETLAPGSSARPGDLIQVQYLASGATHGVIFSRDGRGEVTLHFPSSTDRSTALSGGGVQSLPHAFELDDAPDFERFFFVTAGRNINVRAVLTAAESLGSSPEDDLGLPGDYRQYDFILKKLPPPQEEKP